MIYFDNAATSWPKPEETKKEMILVMEKFGANPGRGAYAFAKETSEYMENARKEIATFLGVLPYRHLLFTSGNTESANTVIKNVLRPGDHVVYTSMEHNAVLRPLKWAEHYGIKTTMVPFISDKEKMLSFMEQSIKQNTRLFAINHGSNVIGTVAPLAEIVDLAKKYNILVFADMAQTAGFLDFPISVEGLDFAAFAGHKSLLGYGGIGLLYIRDPKKITPLIHGGTGMLSYLENQPGILPAGFEAGTRNLIGIGSVLGGIRYLKKRGLSSIREHEMKCCNYFLKGLQILPKIEIYNMKNVEHLPVISLNVEDYSPGEVSQILNKTAGICVRSGLHCAPLAHKTIGTLNRGTVRFSFGPFNTINEVDETLNVLEWIQRK